MLIMATLMLATSDKVFGGIDVGDCDSVQHVIVVIAGSTMGATVEELKREVGKLKGHILSQVHDQVNSPCHPLLCLRARS